MGTCRHTSFRSIMTMKTSFKRFFLTLYTLSMWNFLYRRKLFSLLKLIIRWYFPKGFGNHLRIKPPAALFCWNRQYDSLLRRCLRGVSRRPIAFGWSLGRQVRRKLGVWVASSSNL